MTPEEVKKLFRNSGLGTEVPAPEGDAEWGRGGLVREFHLPKGVPKRTMRKEIARVYRDVELFWVVAAIEVELRKYELGWHARMRFAGRPRPFQPPLRR